MSAFLPFFSGGSVRSMYTIVLPAQRRTFSSLMPSSGSSGRASRSRRGIRTCVHPGIIDGLVDEGIEPVTGSWLPFTS